MGKILRLVLLACIVAMPGAGIATASNGSAMVRQLKQQQKQEMKGMKALHRQQKQSMRGMDPATRAAMKHRMQREEREMREKHHDQRQDLKDQIRMVNANRRR
jgi:hypothetical protein